MGHDLHMGEVLAALAGAALQRAAVISSCFYVTCVNHTPTVFGAL